MSPRLHQMYLMTRNLDRSVQFYEDVLDLDVQERGSKSAAFETGDCVLKVEQDFDEDTLAAFGLSPPGDDRGSGVIAVVEVDDVNAVHEQACEHEGAEVLTKPRNVDWGRRLCLIEDPDGYVVEVSRPLTNA